MASSDNEFRVGFFAGMGVMLALGAIVCAVFFAMKSIKTEKMESTTHSDGTVVVLKGTDISGAVIDSETDFGDRFYTVIVDAKSTTKFETTSSSNS